MRRRKTTRGRLPRSWACIWKGHLLIRRDGEYIHRSPLRHLQLKCWNNFALLRMIGEDCDVAPEIPGDLQLIARAVADGWWWPSDTPMRMMIRRAPRSGGGAARGARLQCDAAVYASRSRRHQRDYDRQDATAEIIADGVQCGGAGHSGVTVDEGIRHGVAGERRHRCNRDARRKLSLGQF